MLQTETSDGLSHETLKVTKNVISKASASSKLIYFNLNFEKYNYHKFKLFSN